jgi:hypothetical protein
MEIDFEVGWVGRKPVVIGFLAKAGRAADRRSGGKVRRETGLKGLVSRPARPAQRSASLGPADPTYGDRTPVLAAFSSHQSRKIPFNYHPSAISTYNFNVQHLRSPCQKPPRKTTTKT